MLIDLNKTRSDLDKPLETSRGLPNPMYISPEGMAMEQQSVLPNNWACIGSTADVPEIGDAVPVDFCGTPLMLLRTGKDEIRVFHNVCLHRGMVLIRAKKRIKGVITCPYHSWSYDMTGKLLKTPKAGGGESDEAGLPDIDCMGLKEVKSHVWLETIYINLNGNAPAFEDQFDSLLERWKEFDSAKLYHGGESCHFDLELNCNWKLAVENFCESYHLPWVHPNLNSYSRIEDHYHIESDNYSGQGTTVYSPNFGSNKPSFPCHEGLSEKWDKGAEYVAAYPNVLLGIHKDHYYSIRIEALAHNRTREVIDLFYFTEEAAFSDEFSELRLANKAQWREVFEEDIFAVEGMQKGRHSPAFDGGRFTPKNDGPTHCFHKWVACNLA